MPALESSTSLPSSPSKRKWNDTSNEYSTNEFDVTQHMGPTVPLNVQSSRGGFDERIPVSLMDHDFSEMTTIDMTDSPPAQEMQEKSGGGLLSGTASSRFGRPNQGSMDRIGEESGEDAMEISHIEFAE